jgi:putative transposase
VSRRRDFEVDPDQWPAFDVGALPPVRQIPFKARRLAVELYASGTTLSQIESRTGVERRHFYRLLERCLALHEDGRLFGWRGLVPYARAGGYERVAGVTPGTDGGTPAAAGAFSQLLKAHPALAEWLADSVRHKRVALDQLSTDDGLRLRLRGLRHLHDEFLRQCRSLGLGPTHYPFNVERMGIRSLSSALRQECLRSFGRGARLAGATRLKGSPSEPSATAATQALDVVEFDGHRLDLRLKVVVRDPLGFEQEFEIERIWLLVVIDVWTRAVLGYHVSLNREYSRYDVIRAIEAALEPHRRRLFTLPGVGYGASGGFPSEKLPELGYATWQWFKLDNAKANLAEDVRHALADFIGCFIDAGPAHTPDDRPYIERFFGTIASSLSSRLPGYTGSHPRDVRRALGDPASNLRLYVSLGELEELLEAAIGGYNASPHAGLNGRTPLEAMEHSIRVRGAILNWSPEAKRRTLCLMQTPRRTKVRGYLEQGQRPHINFHGVRYTNALLASTGAFLGRELRVYYNSQDLRVVRAFASDGAEIGVLKAQGAWGEIAHDLKLRQEIIRQRGRKRLSGALSRDFLHLFVERKLADAKRSRRAASELAHVLQALTAAPTSLSIAPGAHNEPTAAYPPANATTRIEPERLRIGSGYAGGR